MLNDKSCKNAKPTEKPKRMFDGGGLYLEVTPKGQKYWRLKYRFGGKEKRLAIGVYPTVTLAEARSHREAAKKALAQGLDPSLKKQSDKREQTLNSENNFESLAREWHQHYIEKWTPGHAATILRRLEYDVFPEIGNTPIKNITAPMLLSMVQKVEARGANVIARRVLQMSGQVFRYAIITGRGENDPTTALKGALKPFKKGHHAALEADDLPEFLNKLYKNETRLFPLTKMAVEMLMLTFVRTGELIKAKWSEFNMEEGVWMIPAERMKMRRDHIVPLSKQTVTLLKEIQLYSSTSEYLFPARSNLGKHMSNNTVLVALGRMGYKGKATGHGFRALAMSTIKEKLGYRHEVVDRQLAHAHRNSIDAAYDRAKFLDERKVMMQDWADYLATVAKQNVIEGKFGRAI